MNLLWCSVISHICDVAVNFRFLWCSCDFSYLSSMWLAESDVKIKCSKHQIVPTTFCIFSLLIQPDHNFNVDRLRESVRLVNLYKTKTDTSIFYSYLSSLVETLLYCMIPSSTPWVLKQTRYTFMYIAYKVFDEMLPSIILHTRCSMKCLVA